MTGTVWNWSPVTEALNNLAGYYGQQKLYQNALQGMFGSQSPSSAPVQGTTAQMQLPAPSLNLPSAPAAPGGVTAQQPQSPPVNISGLNIPALQGQGMTGPMGQMPGADMTYNMLKGLPPQMGFPMLLQTAQKQQERQQGIADRKIAPLSDQEAQAAGLPPGVWGRDISGNIVQIARSDMKSPGAIKQEEDIDAFKNKLPMNEYQAATVRDSNAKLAEEIRHNKADESNAANKSDMSAPVTVEAADPKNPGQRTQFLAQQDKKTGQWYTGDQTRTPLTDVMLPGGVPGGGRAAAQVGRMMGAAKDVATGLRNVSQLPITSSTGLMGLIGGKQEAHGLWDASRTVLANQMTPQEVQSTKAMYVGIAKAIGTLDAGGLQTSDMFLKQIGGLLPAEGDTHMTKLLKLAELRQQADNALETQLNGPLLSSQQKIYAKSLRDDLEKAIPWAPLDVINLIKSKDPNAKISDFAKGVGLGAQNITQAPSGVDQNVWQHDGSQAGSSGGSSGGASAPNPQKPPPGWTLHQDAHGNRAYVSPDGKQFMEAK